jgi:hypothetical protein
MNLALPVLSIVSLAIRPRLPLKARFDRESSILD